jgi:hypothetical protein
MTATTPMSNTDKPENVLIVGRSPGVLVQAVEMLRAHGYSADATNQFDSVLDDYDIAALDVLVFGGMIPPETKRNLRDLITRRNPHVTFVQGLAGIGGIVAAQVESIGTPDVTGDIVYDAECRAIRFALDVASQVRVEAWWGTSFTPPEPTSTSLLVWDGKLEAGHHVVALPEQVPDVASFAVVTVGPTIEVLTIGEMPIDVTRMVPTSADDTRLPEVARLSTHANPSSRQHRR